MTTTQRPTHRLLPIGTDETLVLGDSQNHSTTKTDLAALIACDTERVAADLLAVTVRSTETAALLWWREQNEVDRIEPSYGTTADCDLARSTAEIENAAIEAELARRERASRNSSGVASPGDAEIVAWVAVARQLADEVPVPVALERLGHPMRRVGRDKERREEYHGACPFCGGSDRFMAWGPPRSRYLCRQCSNGRARDVVTLWRNVTGLGLREACEELLTMAGVPR